MIYVSIVLLISLVMGVPIAFTVGVSDTVFPPLNTHFPLTHVAQPPLAQVQSIPMLVIPLFILASNLMNNGGTTKRLVNLATLLAGYMRDGLVQTSAILSILMGGASGLAMADATTGTRLLGPDMIKGEYSEGFSTNILTFTSLITVTIPPGVGLIIYGTTDSASIRKLFSVSIFVGLYTAIILVVSVAVIARMRGYKSVRQDRATWEEIDVNLKGTAWVVMFPVVLLVGIRMELFSLSEVRALVCLYSVLVDTFIYKRLTTKFFITASRDSIADIGFVMMIASLTALFGYDIPIDKIPQKMTTFITGIITNPLLALVLVIVLPVFVGMLMKGSVVILLLTLILLPMCQPVGIDPVHLGLLIYAIVTMGVNTSSVGISMHMASIVLGRSLQEYTKSMVSFLTVILPVIGLPASLSDVVLSLLCLLY